MNHFRKGWMVLGLLLWAGMGSAQESGASDDLAAAQLLWQQLVAERLVGDQGIYSTPRSGKPPHGAFIDTVTAFVEREGEMAPLIVQRNYAGNQINRRAAANDPERWLQSISVMFKREAGYSPRTKDWFWAQYAPNGELLRDAKDQPQAGTRGSGGSGCIACHMMAPGGDLVFNHNRFSTRKKK